MAILNVNFGNNENIKKENDSKVKNQLKMLQANGHREIKEYEQKVEEFIEYISSLAVYKKICNDVFGDQIRRFLITEISDGLVKPIFEGDIPPFMSEESYKDLREDVYKDLLDKYMIGNEDDDDPFKEI